MRTHICAAALQFSVTAHHCSSPLSVWDCACVRATDFSERPALEDNLMGHETSGMLTTNTETPCPSGAPYSPSQSPTHGSRQHARTTKRLMSRSYVGVDEDAMSGGRCSQRVSLQSVEVAFVRVNSQHCHVHSARCIRLLLDLRGASSRQKNFEAGMIRQGAFVNKTGCDLSCGTIRMKLSFRYRPLWNGKTILPCWCVFVSVRYSVPF